MRLLAVLIFATGVLRFVRFCKLFELLNFLRAPRSLNSSRFECSKLHVFDNPDHFYASALWFVKFLICPRACAFLIFWLFLKPRFFSCLNAPAPAILKLLATILLKSLVFEFPDGNYDLLFVLF